MSMFYILLRQFALHEKQKIIYQIATFTARLNSHKPLVYCTFYELWMQLMSCVCDLNLVDLIHNITSFFTGNWKLYELMTQPQHHKANTAACISYEMRCTLPFNVPLCKVPLQPETAKGVCPELVSVQKGPFLHKDGTLPAGQV